MDFTSTTLNNSYNKIDNALSKFNLIIKYFFNISIILEHYIQQNFLKLVINSKENKINSYLMQKNKKHQQCYGKIQEE